MTDYNLVIIGAGQAGLAMGYHLKKAVVLKERVGPTLETCLIWTKKKNREST